MSGMPAPAPSRLEDADRVFVGVDVGRKRDSSAIVCAAVIDDVLHVAAEILRPDDWPPGRGRRCSRAVLAVAHDHAVAEVVYDPHQFQESAELLEEQGLVHGRNAAVR